MWAKAIEREIARLESGDLEAGMARIARKLVRIADAGDDDKSQWALREIGDRIDGKPAQAVVTEDEEGRRQPIAWPLPQTPLDR